MQTRDLEFETYFKSKTLHYLTQIEGAVSDVLDQFVESRFHESLTFAVRDGKRIRPLIVLLVRDALADGNNVPNVDPMRAAIAIELLHLESIIHDDIIDDEEQRRGKPSFHKKYGLPASILSADFVLGVILDIASQYSDTRIGRELSRAALRMSNGEFMEVIINDGSASQKISLNQYIDVIRDKTASLFQSSAKIGALLSGAGRNDIEAVSDFGLNLGIAYQMQDDLLDWDEKVSLARRVSADQRSLQSLSQEYATKARASLVNIPSGEARDRLQELAEFAVSRRF
jgi:octaprenyl-diphosphate synthase